MDSLRRALAFRFLLWLIHSAISICIFPIRQSNRPLFESTVSVVLAIAIAFLNVYFRRFAREGAILGVLCSPSACCAISDSSASGLCRCRSQTI